MASQRWKSVKNVPSDGNKICITKYVRFAVFFGAPKTDVSISEEPEIKVRAIVIRQRQYAPSVITC